MNDFIDEGLEKTEEKRDMRNECFGWWLSDIISEPLDYLKNDAYDSGVFSEKFQLASDESLTSGSQWDRSDLNGKVSGLEIEDEDHSRITTEHNEHKNNDKYTLLTAARTNLRTRRKPRIQKQDKTSADDSPTEDLSSSILNVEQKEEKPFTQEELCDDILFSNKILSLINPQTPNRNQLAAILNDISIPSREPYQPREPANSTVSLYGENINQNECSKGKIDSKSKGHCKMRRNSKKVTGGVIGDMVLIAEHEVSDRELEESRGSFLKTASGLDSRLRNLEADMQQLHTDATDLYNDFQMQENALSRLTEGARRLVSDLQNIRYLDDLIFLLQGQLDRITLRKWPFILAHVLPQNDSSQEFNLIV